MGRAAVIHSDLGEVRYIAQKVEQASQQIVDDRTSISGKLPMAKGKASMDALFGAGKPWVDRFAGGEWNSQARTELSEPQIEQLPLNEVFESVRRKPGV
jgi:hypothetical protein